MSIRRIIKNKLKATSATQSISIYNMRILIKLFLKNKIVYEAKKNLSLIRYRVLCTPIYKTTLEAFVTVKIAR